MKKVLMILFCVFAACRMQAQRPATYVDTANYLMNIENKKSDYIGKPFSALIDTLKIKLVYIIPVYSRDKDSFAKKLHFYFNYEQAFEKNHILTIAFSVQPAYDIIYPLLFPGVGQPINVDAVINLYKSLVIQDVVVKNYYEDPDWLPLLKENTPIENNTLIREQQKTIIKSLDKYFSKPFSLLWNDLSIKPKTIQGTACPLDPAKECTTTFYYGSPDSLSVTYFRITWGGGGIPKKLTQQYQLGMIRDFTDNREFLIYADKIMADYIWISPASLYQEAGVLPVSKQPKTNILR